MKISVVVCTYNGARYLRNQLDSILMQTLQPAEIIVQDDGSTDETWAILEEYATKDKRFKLFHNEGAHGINSNFFSAMHRAVNPWLALSDQDDIWEIRKLELQSEAIGSALLCSGRSVPFSEEGFPVSHDLRKPNYHILRIVFLGVLPGHTFLVRREILDLLPRKNECPYMYDWQLQMVAAAAESIVFVDETLVHFRRHEDAATASKPVGRQLISRSAWNYVWTTLRHHTFLQSEVRKRFKNVDCLVAEFPFDSPSLGLYRRMSELQQKRGFIALICLMAFCGVHRELFYAHEKRTIVAVLRALYFPFSCGYYYREKLYNKKSKH